MMNYIVQEGQTLLDIVIEKYGSLEGLADVLALNPSISQGTIVQPGDVLVLNPPVNTTRTEFDRKVYNVATKAVQTADIVRPDVSVVPITTPGSGSPVRIVDAALIRDYYGSVDHYTEVYYNDVLVDDFAGDTWSTVHTIMQDVWSGGEAPIFLLYTNLDVEGITVGLQSYIFDSKYALPALRASWDQNGPAAEFWINAAGYAAPVFCYIDWGDGASFDLLRIDPSPTRQLIHCDYSDGLDFHHVKVYATEVLTELSFPGEIVPTISGDLYLGGVRQRHSFNMDMPVIRSVKMIQEFVDEDFYPWIHISDDMSTDDTPLIHATIDCYNASGLGGTFVGFYLSAWNLQSVSLSFDSQFQVDIRSRFLERISITPRSHLDDSLIEIFAVQPASRVNSLLKQLYEIVAKNYGYSSGLSINMSVCAAPDSTSGNIDGLAYVALLNDLNVSVTTA